MKKIKKGGKENEAASFYTADEFFLRKGYQIPDLVTEVRKEAYVSGFNRGQEQAYYGFWNKDCQKLFNEETRKVEEHEHCWTAHDEWQEHVARTAFNLAASAYKEYMGGKSSVDDAMNAIVAVLRTEFVNTRVKQVAENAGKIIPVPPEEKWLSDDEDEGEGVSMLTMTREILKEGRKEGYDIGYMKGYMAAQSKE